MASSSGAPKPGYVYERVPLSAPEQIAKHGVSRTRTIVRSAIQAYIKSFFDNGKNAPMFSALNPASLQYSLDTLPTDPTKRHIQIERLWERMHEKLPCVIVADSGATLEAVGLGGYADGFVADDGQRIIRFTQPWVVPITLLMGAKDEDTVMEINNSMSLMFGTLLHVTEQAGILVPATGIEHWEVRLPLPPIDFTSPQNRPIGSDTVDQLWTNEMSLTNAVQFEETFEMDYAQFLASQEDTFAVEMYADNEQLDESGEPVNGLPVQVEVDIPDTVKLGTALQVNVGKWPAGSALYSDNPSIAILDENLVLQARRVGEFNLIMSKRGETPKVLWAKSVEVVV